MSSPAAFAKMYAASDTQLILGVPAKPPALRGKEEQRRERAGDFYKKVAASDMQLILGVPAKPPALRGEEERRSE